MRWPVRVVLVWSVLVSFACVTRAAGSDGPCPPLAASDADPPPRVMRFRASGGSCPPQGCYGLVLDTARDGTPRRVLNLTTYRRDSERDRLPASPRIFALASELWTKHRRTALWDDHATRSHTETLPADRLAEVVLPAVAISRDDLVYGRVVIVGAGRNYPEHAAETGGGSVFFFPKTVIPTGPYAALPDPGPQTLLDYEAELAFVVLEPIDLSSPESVPSESALEKKIAWVVADDLTDRTPHLTDPTGNPERGKSQPGFLPLGPWMVAAKELPLWSNGRALRIQTEVRGTTGVRCAQQALTSDMQLAPSALLQELSRYLTKVDSIGREPVRLGGALRRFSLARRGPRGFDLPAGSVILTGTPPGTAFGATPKPPAPAKGLGALFGSGSSGAKVIDQVKAERHLYGYLSAGDEVSITIQNLGRQDLEVTGAAP
jgi:2-keto-4-pentenoate hydratase/2-oxohepta-3-ene-1,7-dioic acid hydratase in catechol pathway